MNNGTKKAARSFLVKSRNDKQSMILRNKEIRSKALRIGQEKNPREVDWTSKAPGPSTKDKRYTLHHRAS